MNIVADKNLKLAWVPWSPKQGALHSTFVVKACFVLKHSEAARPADEPLDTSGDIYRDDDLAKGLIYPSDFAAFKPRADAILLASAHAPSKQPGKRLPVRFKLGAMDKGLAVFGPRLWQTGVLGRSAPNEIAPFVTAKIDYENAHGGPKFKKNPVGRGIDTDDLPQIETPQAAIGGERKESFPAGFGPISPSWLPRCDMIGTYDKKWTKERWPWLPLDFDFSYFNSAPPDQQIEGFLKGDEELLFENLHPEHATYRSQLPGIRARCFIEERAAAGASAEATLQYREVPLVLDTAWINLEEEKLVLVWRGNVAVRSIKLREVERIVAWTEPLSERPKPPSYCPTFIAEQNEAYEKEIDVPNEAPGAEEAASVAAKCDVDIAAAEKELDDAVAEGEAIWVQQKAQLIASGVDPASLETPPATQTASQALRELIAKEPPGNVEQIAALQSDLANFEQMEAEVAAMESEFAASFPADMTREQLLAAVARRESFANRELLDVDLAGIDMSGMDFRGATLSRGKFAGANFQNANLSEVDFGQADLSGADLTGAILDSASFRKAKLDGVKIAKASLVETIFSGVALAGADFSGCTGLGADFSKCDLAGCRFTGTNLPRADFSNAKLARADFAGAAIGKSLLEGVEAQEANFAGADLTGLNASEGADFTGSNFTKVRAAGASFDRSKFDRVDFSRAILERAQFSEASLREAKFDRVHGTGASFDDADLTKAILTHANFLRASFERADLTDANLQGSNLYEAGFWDAVRQGTNFRDANLKGTTLA